jgi:hypothetical protein
MKIFDLSLQLAGFRLNKAQRLFTEILDVPEKGV